MQVIEVDIPYRFHSDYYLYGLGDIHDAVIHSDTDLLKDKVKEIRNTPNALWIGMGDYSDLIMPSDFKRWDGRILADWMRGNEHNIAPTQLEHVESILHPIWSKCIGLIRGNHDDYIMRYHNFDYVTELLKKANYRKLERPVKDAGVSCLIALKFIRNGSSERHNIIIHARHGEGAARTSGARALAVLRLASTFTNAHITLSGHLHGQESPDIPQRLVYKAGHIVAFEAVACMTGAWLKAYMEDVPPCYVERWGVTPSVLGCPRIHIETKDWKLTLEKSRLMATSLV